VSEDTLNGIEDTVERSRMAVGRVSRPQACHHRGKWLVELKKRDRGFLPG